MISKRKQESFLAFGKQNRFVTSFPLSTSFCCIAKKISPLPALARWSAARRILRPAFYWRAVRCFVARLYFFQFSNFQIFFSTSSRRIWITACIFAITNAGLCYKQLSSTGITNIDRTEAGRSVACLHEWSGMGHCWSEWTVLWLDAQ